MTVQPGAGERAEPPPPTYQRPPGEDQRRFQEPVEAWIDDGANTWWRIEIVDMPPRSERAARRLRYTNLRNGLVREIDRQRGLGRIPIETRYATHMTKDDDGRTYLTWGPVKEDSPGE